MTLASHAYYFAAKWQMIKPSQTRFKQGFQENALTLCRNLDNNETI